MAHAPRATRGRPQRARQASQRVRQKPTIQPHESDEDEFNFQQIDQSNDSEEPDTQSQSNNATRASTPSVQSVEPSAKSTKEAKDIKMFIEIKFVDVGGTTEKKRVCKLCAMNPPSSGTWQYAISTTTNTLRSHLTRLHYEAYAQACEENGWNYLERLSRGKGKEKQAEGMPVAERSRAPFTQKAFIDLLIKFIVADDQSIYVVECPEFRDLLLFLGQNLEEKNIPRRTKMRACIIDAWKDYFRNLRKDLSNSVGEISFTADMWSSKTRYPYLAVTAHWLGQDQSSKTLRLNSALIAFHRVRGKHSGERLARIAIDIMDRAEITSRSGHWTLDNAGTNKSFMAALKTELSKRDFTFDPSDRHIMCIAHVINIATRHVVEASTTTNYTDDQDDYDIHPQAHRGSRDVIALCRTTVRAIRASGQRLERFNETIDLGNASGWFTEIGPDGTEQVTQLRKLQLLRDVKTRWDSVYMMLQVFLEMRPAIEHFLLSPLNKDLKHLSMTTFEWTRLQDFAAVLEVRDHALQRHVDVEAASPNRSLWQCPHIVQQIMSAEKTPTLTHCMIQFEMFMTAWEKLGAEHPDLKEYTDVGLKWATKYYQRMDSSRAYLIAMVLDPCIRLAYIKMNWDAEYITRAIRTIKDLMDEYRARSSDVSAPVPALPAVGHVAASNPWKVARRYGIADLMDFDKNPKRQDTIDEEYERYFGNGISLSHYGTNILKFWDANATNLPTLYKMALDYIPIQATSVPSERVFSSASETDTKRRNKIHPSLMEALQILKFGLRRERLNFGTGMLTSTSEMLETVEDEPDHLAAIATDTSDPLSVDALIGAIGMQANDEHDDEESAL